MNRDLGFASFPHHSFVFLLICIRRTCRRILGTSRSRGACQGAAATPGVPETTPASPGHNHLPCSGLRVNETVEKRIKIPRIFIKLAAKRTKGPRPGHFQRVERLTSHSARQLARSRSNLSREYTAYCRPAALSYCDAGDERVYGRAYRDPAKVGSSLVFNPEASVLTVE